MLVSTEGFQKDLTSKNLQQIRMGPSLWERQEAEKSPPGGDHQVICSITCVIKSVSALGDSDRQGSLQCFSPRGGKESDMTERLN